MFHPLACPRRRPSTPLPVLTLLAIATTATLSVPVQAADLKLGDLRFDRSEGDFRITGGSKSSEFYTIQQEVYGPNVNLFMSIRGFPELFDSGYVGIRVKSIVKNLTDTPWIYFDHELQQTKRKRSPEEDGLSFAQGYREIRPFSATRFTKVVEEQESRDYINFSRGVVNPGETITFIYAITDNSPNDKFYLLQRPNFKSAKDGFVTPPTPQPAPSPSPVASPAPSPSPKPVPPKPVPPKPAPPKPVPPVSPPISLPSLPPIEPPPSNTAAVPEPSTMLGGLAAIAGSMWLKRRRGTKP